MKDRLFDKVHAVCLESSDALDHPKYLLWFHVLFIGENQGAIRIMLSEDIYGSSPERKNRVFKMIERHPGKIGDIVREVQKEFFLAVK